MSAKREERNEKERTTHRSRLKTLPFSVKNLSELFTAFWFACIEAWLAVEVRRPALAAEVVVAEEDAVVAAAPPAGLEEVRESNDAARDEGAADLEAMRARRAVRAAIILAITLAFLGLVDERWMV